MDSSFQLDPSEHDRIYELIIEPTSFDESASVDRPALVIIAGQTGAGKSAIVQLSIKKLSNAIPVTVNTDDLRAYHPKFEEIVMLDDTRAAERTHHDASAWRAKLLARCIQTKRHVILEGVFKDSQSLLEIVASAKANGYEVIVRVVAAHERYSVWGIHRRYEKEKIVRGHGRFVPIEYHDECYTKLLDTLNAIEEQRLVNGIEVYDRDGTCRYSNTLVDGNWTDQSSAKVAVEEVRNEPLSEEQQRQYVESWRRVFEYMEQRRASPENIAAVRALANRFIPSSE